MSKKRTNQSSKTKSDPLSEEMLDIFVRAMLTPKNVAFLLKDKSFVKETLKETRKAQKDKEDIKGLGEKYHVDPGSVEQSLGEVEEMLTKILGDQSDL